MPALNVLQRTNSPVVAALVTAICWTLFLAHLFVARDADISRFVVAGGPGVDPDSVPAGLTVIPGIGGYDGAIFYRLALDPFTTVQSAHGITLDNPAYRQQRIGYPLMVWILSLGGRPRLVPWMLVAVNLIALVAMAAIGGALCRHYGQHALGGLVFPFFPGYLWSLSRDLSEITACCFMLAAIFAITTRRFVASAVFLTLAVMTRETTLMLAIAIGCIHVLERLRGRPARVPKAVFITPLIVYVTGQLILAAIWGDAPVNAGRPSLTVPFAQFMNALSFAWPRRIQLERLYFEQCIVLAVVTAVTLYVVLRSRPRGEWVVAWSGNLFIASTLAPGDWVADIVFLRILCDLYLLSGVVVVSNGSRTARAILFVATIAFWYRLALIVVALR